VAWSLMLAGLLTVAIPWWAPFVIDSIVMRHPLDAPIPVFWQKVDPALGSMLVFLLPCLALAALPTFMIRVATAQVERVGRVSGGIYAASTGGNIVGVFTSGYVLLDHMNLSTIFHGTGFLIILLGISCLLLDRSLRRSSLSPLEK
jgi:hypothetical protein